MDKYFNLYREMISLRGLTDHTLKSYSTCIRPYPDYLYNLLHKTPEDVFWQELHNSYSRKEFKNKLYSTTWNVYAKPNKCNPKTVIKYIDRYLGRPVIATSRIDRYNGKMVTFHYNRHEDEKYVKETIPAMEFIECLIRHIPEKNYKMIRYGDIMKLNIEELHKNTSTIHRKE